MPGDVEAILRHQRRSGQDDQPQAGGDIEECPERQACADRQGSKESEERKGSRRIEERMLSKL